MKRVLVVLVVAVVGLGASCSNDEKLGAGEARLSVERGSRVLAGRRGDGLRLVTGDRRLGLGSQVKVLAGSAVVALDDGSTVEVRKGSEIELGSPMSLVAGDALVTTSGRPLTVAAAGSQVQVAGAARLLRDLAVSAASYQGQVTLRSAGRSLVVPALRQAGVPTLGELPDQPEPLEYDAADPWDRRFLGEAIDMGAELEAKSQGFTASLQRGEGTTPGFYRQLLPELGSEPAFGPSLLSSRRPPGETLVGAAIVVAGRQGSFAERWNGVFGFREQGAAWGLVALDQQVTDVTALGRTVDLAIGRVSFAFAPPSSVPSSSAPSDVPRTPRPSSTPASSPTPTSRPAPPSSPPTTRPPAGPAPTTPTLPLPVPTTPPPSGERQLLAPLLDTVGDTLDGLLPGS